MSARRVSVQGVGIPVCVLSYFYLCVMSPAKSKVTKSRHYTLLFTKKDLWAFLHYNQQPFAAIVMQSTIMYVCMSSSASGEMRRKKVFVGVLLYTTLQQPLFLLYLLSMSLSLYPISHHNKYQLHPTFPFFLPTKRKTIYTPLGSGRR